MKADRRQALVAESARRFLRRSAYGHLQNLLAKIRPQDFPLVYDAFSERERELVFTLLAKRAPATGGGFLVELPIDQSVAMVRRLDTPISARLIGAASEDDAAALLSELDEEEAARILEALQPEEKASVEKLLIYEEETAGRIMTPDLFSLHENTLVGEATDALRSTGDVEIAFYLYVVDDRGHFVGVVSLRELLLNPVDTPLKQIMNTDLISVRTDTDQEEVAQIVSKYDLLAIPVVDEQGRLVGIVTIDDVIDVLREEATEDIFRMAGTSEEERIEPTIFKSARIRSPWLLAAFVGGVLASIVIGAFEDFLTSGLAVLVIYVPLTLGVGGSAGNQSAIVIIRGLATGRLREGILLRSFGREMGVSLLLGISYGLLLFCWSFGYLTLMQGDLDLEARLRRAVVMGLALCLSMIMSTSMGAMFPLLLHRMKIDPTVATTPFVTTVTDFFGSLIIFALAYSLIVL